MRCALRRGPSGLAFLLLACLPLAPQAAEKAALLPYWEAHEAGSSATIDHSIWARFLARHLHAMPDGTQRLRWAAITPEDRARLGIYLEKMQALPVSRYARDEQAAYWINLHNAGIVKLMADWYPRASIRELNLSPSLFEKGPFGAQLFAVEGRRLSFEDIVHGILRPIWQDPRMHYALFTTARSGPDLPPDPLRGATLDAQLDQAARAFVNDPRGVRVAGGQVHVSRIYDWYEKDFGGSKAAVTEHLQRFAAPALAAVLKDRRLRVDDYDWRLAGVR